MGGGVLCLDGWKWCVGREDWGWRSGVWGEGGMGVEIGCVGRKEWGWRSGVWGGRSGGGDRV